MLNLLLTGWFALGVPFNDPEQRFGLDLPPGWEIGPLAGAEAGASFRYAAGSELALAAVRVFPAKGPQNAAAIARQLAKGIDGQPGYRLLEEVSTELAGLPAARRRYLVYVDGNPDMVKMVEDRVLVSNRRAFVVHVESLQGAFATFEADFDHLFQTFQLGGGPVAVLDARIKSPIVGKWRMQGTTDTFLDLRPNGSFDLAGAKGRYSVQGHDLVMRPGTGGREEFGWSLERGELVLSAPSLGEPIHYERVGPAPGGGAPVSNSVAGQWAGGGRALLLGPGKKVTLDGKQGAYRVDGKRIIFRFGKKRKIARFKVTGDQLILSGGGFGKATVMKRQ